MEEPWGAAVSGARTIFLKMGKATFYEKLVYVAYCYYILISLGWFVASLAVGGYLNVTALGALAAFAVQLYYRHKVTHLVFGILLLAFSIFFGLQFLWLGGKRGFDLFSGTMSALAAISIIFSVVLVFGYLKISFKD